MFGVTCPSCGKKVKRRASVCPSCGTKILWGAAARAAKQGYPPVITKSYRGLMQFKGEARQLASAGYVVASQETHKGFTGPQIIVSYRKVG